MFVVMKKIATFQHYYFFPENIKGNSIIVLSKLSPNAFCKTKLYLCVFLIFAESTLCSYGPICCTFLSQFLANVVSTAQNQQFSKNKTSPYCTVSHKGLCLGKKLPANQIYGPTFMSGYKRGDKTLIASSALVTKIASSIRKIKKWKGSSKYKNQKGLCHKLLQCTTFHCSCIFSVVIVIQPIK